MQIILISFVLGVTVIIHFAKPRTVWRGDSAIKFMTHGKRAEHLSSNVRPFNQNLRVRPL